LTLGCGGYGGNITSDNISPLHLLNIKRLAYEVKSVQPAAAPPTSASNAPALPRAPVAARPAGLAADALTQRIDQFLSTRGFSAPLSAGPPSPAPPPATGEAAAGAAEFVCEDDVRLAHQEGRRIRIDDDTIVTPSARDYGDAHDLFIHSDWRG
jgi:acetaldehyde dehydrogenase (acetylating)